MRKIITLWVILSLFSVSYLLMTGFEAPIQFEDKARDNRPMPTSYYDDTPFPYEQRDTRAESSHVDLLSHVLQGELRDVIVLGSYAYTVAGKNFLIFDISDKSNPTPIGILEIPSASYGLDIAGSYAYIANSLNGLWIVDISDATDPSLTGAYQIENLLSYDVSVYGNYAYVANIDFYDRGGVTVINIASPSNPTEEDYISLWDYVTGVHAVYPYLYVANSDRGLRILDITDPANPIPRGYDESFSAHRVFSLGDYAYVATTHGLWIVDVSNPNNPTNLSYYDSNVNSAYDVYIRGSYAYIADLDEGLKIMDVTVPANPLFLGGYDTDGYAHSVFSTGNDAYVADMDNGLVILDVQQSSNPSLEGHFFTGDGAADVFVSSNIAYVAGYRSGLRIYDVSTPTSPVAMGALDTYRITSVYVSGDYAYVCADDNNDYYLIIIDVSNPSNPTEEGSYFSLNEVNDIFVEGDYAYIAVEIDGLRIIDISNPSSPQEVSYYSLADEANGVFVSLPYAFIADGEDGLRILNVSNPYTPNEVGVYDTSGSAREVYVHEKYAYVADYDEGLVIIDISDPSKPSRVKSLNTDGNAENVFISDGGLYMADGYEGMRVVDISQPSSAKEIGYYDESGIAYGIFASDGTAFLATDGGGLFILDVSYFLPPKIESTSPNDLTSEVPVNTQITINFDMSMYISSVENAFSYTDGDSEWESSDGSVDWSDEDKTMVFTPNIELEYGLSYAVTVDNSAECANRIALDSDGDGIPGEEEDSYTFKFSTSVMPPKVSLTVPRDNEKKIAPDINIRIAFSKTMHRDSTEAALTYSYTGSTKVYSSINGYSNWSTDSKTLTIDPFEDLKHDKIYTFSIAATARDIEDATLDGNGDGVSQGSATDDYTWSFRIISAPPQVSSTSPANNALNVPIDVEIMMSFDKEMNQDTVENAFGYTHNETTVTYDIFDGSVTWSADSKIMIFEPYTHLDEGKTYTFTLEEDAKDESGIPMEIYSWTFATKPNKRPVLEGGGVHPDTGDSSTTFTFSVVYRDEDGDMPTEIEVVIDGYARRMYESDTDNQDVAEGKSYTLKIELEHGPHSYYFTTENEKHTARYPSTGEISGLEVEGKEDDYLIGSIKTEYYGLPTLICGSLLLIIILVIIAGMAITRRGKQPMPSAPPPPFQPTPTPVPAPMFKKVVDEAEDETSIDIGTKKPEPKIHMPGERRVPDTDIGGPKPTVQQSGTSSIKCPRCGRKHEVISKERPFVMDCDCGMPLVLRR